MGVNTLADGVSSYVDGEKQLADGASLADTIEYWSEESAERYCKMEASTDGKGKDKEDIKVASSELGRNTGLRRFA